MNRATFVIDGFNLYHSILDLYTWHRIRAKWLDVSSLCRSFLSWVGDQAKLQEIYYFSAFAFHLNNPDIILRHETFIRCMRATGVQDVMGRFKPKTLSCPQFDSALASCPNCSGKILRYEEKETDVAIATKILELLSKNPSDSSACETIVIVSGDTDIAPTIRTAKALFSTKSIKIIFPFKRKNQELAQLAPSVNLKPKHYLAHQFPDPFLLSDGTIISKPPSW
jgi:uncharacterized LabA/DUF88 family protein